MGIRVRQLIHNAERPIFLIVDGHPAHKTKAMRKCADMIQDRFRLFFLSPHSPELNHDERVWNDLKSNGIGRKIITNPQQLKSDVISHLRSIQRLLGGRAYFQSEITKYAA